MNRFVLYLLIAIGFLPSALAQTARRVTTFDNELRENSGMAYYGGGVVYLVNDGGNGPKLFRFDTAQMGYTTFDILNGSNADWEDLTTDKFNNLYIGDFGNNDNERKNLRIYKSPDPETIFSNQIAVETIAFTYENQTNFPPADSELNFDCEAMVWHQDSLYIFTKNRTDPYDGWSYMYVLPDSPGSYVAKLRDSIQFTASDKRLGWITAADLRGDSLLLLSSSKVNLGVGFGAKSLSEMIWESYDVGFSQKEAVSFGAKSTDIFISDELNVIGNNLYYLNIAETASLEMLKAKKFKVHQTSSSFSISLKNRRLAHIRVFATMGTEMYNMSFDEEHVISGDDLPPSIYIIQLIVDGESYDFKWAKTE
ncbi:hypothetical protein N9772_04890 [Bacteroidia bacterium]|nr:hypothetical protein [Bacteroidia bacterium]